MALLAALALLVQCLLPISHAFAMSKASQDAAFAQSICSYHPESQAAAGGGEADTSKLGGKLPPCPMCQAGCLGNVLALPSQPPSDLQLMGSGQPSALCWDASAELAARHVFDPASPRGPPAFF